ncbi:MAG: glutamine--fructose-6-phosphate transaminase (isomerizing), partial [Cypionkella sp.]|nr:glutamine--fructose-6-phosphate transaminase (isomerizing) [Cypionkella sp.]
DGVLGNHEVAPLLVESLKRLEYRGYDSAGIATVHKGKLDRRRAVGKLVNLSDLLVHEPLAGKAGIGHTRWATHGAATTTNAHPHRSGPVAVVHNGIIENFRELRAELSAAGLTQESETDTETVALLAHLYISRGATPIVAARQTLKRLHGAFALCFLFDGEEDLIIAARKGSPLAIGHGDGEMFVGSDAIALAPMTDRITYLEEGDWAVITRQGAVIYDEMDRLANRPEARIQVDATRIEKAGYKHFMAKEIAEQPVVIADALRRYVQNGALQLPAEVDFAGVDRLTMVACGTASYACHVAKYWFEQIAGLPCEIDIASEFRYREPPLSPNQWALFVSQSGETADTLAALRYTREKVAKIVAVVNVPTSSIAREADLALPIMAGIEVGVASTKAFTCQLITLALLALKAAKDRGRLTPETLAQHLTDLAALPGLMNHALALSTTIAAIAEELSEAQDVLFLGRGAMFPLALEGALKLKEISYIHAEGYASGELKHGPIA